MYVCREVEAKMEDLRQQARQDDAATSRTLEYILTQLKT